MAASRHRDYRDFDVVYPRSSGLFTAPGKGLATKAVQDRSFICVWKVTPGAAPGWSGTPSTGW